MREALDLLHARLCAAESIGEAFVSAFTERPDLEPPWVSVYRDQLAAIREAAEAVEAASRGVGVVDPDDDLPPAFRTAGHPRGAHVPPAGPSSRPGQPAGVQTPSSAVSE